MPKSSARIHPWNCETVGTEKASANTLEISSLQFAVLPGPTAPPFHSVRKHAMRRWKSGLSALFLHADFSSQPW
jgi:hypothetical protein